MIGRARLKHENTLCSRSSYRNLAVAALLVPLLFTCSPVPEDPVRTTDPDSSAAIESPASLPLFEDVTATVGLGFVHDAGTTGLRTLVEVMGAGGALFDWDGDGDLDVYLVQGGALPPASPPATTDRLYRNQLRETGELAFTDVTEASGLAEILRRAPAGHGMGVATGDVDGDGRPDLYLTRYGPDLLLGNRADGTFEDRTAATGLAETEAAPGALPGSVPPWSVPAVFFDREGDGDLDLFVGRYVHFPTAQLTGEGLPACRDAAGRLDYCGPDLYPPAPDRLLDNRGDGTFGDASRLLAGAPPAGRALGAVAVDTDGDGRPEIFVANDGEANHLWRPTGDGGYREEALAAGVAVNGRGQPEGSMGIAAGDVDGDGDTDLFVTHLITETHTLYRNDGPAPGQAGLFSDLSGPSGLGPPSRPHTGFGTGFLEVDGDGRPDLLAVHGAVQNLPARLDAGDPTPLDEPDFLYRQRPPRADGTPRFEEISGRAGEAFRHVAVSRGAAFGDVDDDGDTDVLVTHNGGPARLLLNRLRERQEAAGSAGGGWLGLRLLVPTAAGASRDALGAVVELRDAGGALLARRTVATAGSYLSASDPRVLFHWPAGAEPSTVAVTWPDGSRERWPLDSSALGGYREILQGASPDTSSETSPEETP